MTEIFRTNLKNKRQVNLIVALLRKQNDGAEVNFDLEDCDKILRIKADHLCILEVIKIVTGQGFFCELLF